jgi:hypothetical protein
MSSEQIVITPVTFQEITAIRLDQATGSDFDIVLPPDFTINDYCTSLIEKVFSIPQSQLNKFIQHQTSLVRDPLVWLNRFEKLIAMNESLFIQRNQVSRHTKLYFIIESKREKVQRSQDAENDIIRPNDRFNGLSHDRLYSFNKTKSLADKLKDFEDKIFFLEDQITEYQQNPPHIVNHNEQDFVKQCQLEITRLTRQHDLKKKVELMQKQDENVFKPLQVNVEAKSWVNVFYQAMHTTGEDGKPVIPGTASEVAQHLCDCYLQMDGSPFNFKTVRTYLSKGGTDGRPKLDKEINLDFDEK